MSNIRCVHHKFFCDTVSSSVCYITFCFLTFHDVCELVVFSDYVVTKKILGL